MNFKKHFKVMTTAALISSLTLTSVSPAVFAKDSKQSNVTAKAENGISQIILEKNGQLIQVPYLTFVFSVNGQASLNGYSIKYIEGADNQIYSIRDYALYYVKNDTPGQLLERLKEAGKETSLENQTVLKGSFIGGKLFSENENVLTTPKEITPTGQTTELTEAGTYGGTKDNPQVIEGNIIVKNNKVNLSNVIIKGELTISSDVEAGDIIIDNTEVVGDTYVKGGGLNSIHFVDSVIATVIVNKNDGKVRVVVSGSSNVEEVRLESYAKLEEESLDSDAEGFTDVMLDPTVQYTPSGLEFVEFIGSYNTINSKARGVKLNIPAGTNIETIALDAIATVLGEGFIKNAEINQNATGSVFNQSLENVVLNNGATIQANGEEITESTSTATEATINRAILSPDSVAIGLSNYVANINKSDFKVEATIDGQSVELEDLNYDEEMKRLFFTPVVNASTIGKQLKVKITPQGKLKGESITTESITLQEGFSGRITTVQGVGMPNVAINFRDSEDELEIMARTDAYGYYFVNAPAGDYRGEITGSNVVTTPMYAYATTNHFNTEQNETAIATAASSELKVVVEWGKYPTDVDSHLVGLNEDGNPFHVYYSNPVSYNDKDQSIIDLDWDDVDSYGPETTTFRKLNDGQYIFYLHNFSGNYQEIYNPDTDDYEEVKTSLADSEAVIKVYKGNSVEAVKTIKIADLQSTSKDLYFYAYGIEIKNNGQDINIIPVNKFDSYVDSYDLTDMKSYLNTIKNSSENFLANEDIDKTKESYQAFIKAFEEAKLVDAETADFETLLNKTLSLKSALSSASMDYYDEYYEDEMY